jgi:hypothetical protein
VPITEIIEIAATLVERTLDFGYMPGMIWNKAMSSVERTRARTPKIDDNTIVA